MSRRRAGKLYGYKNHIAIDRAYGFIRRAAVSDAAHHDGAMLRCLVTSNNLAASVWADTAYRSQANEAWLASIGRVPRIHRKKPPGRPMPRHVARANARRTLPTQASLADVQADAKALETDLSGVAPTRFEIVMIRDTGGRFAGRRTFIEDLEKLVPEFYDNVGQHLRPWTPPPPTIDKLDTASPAATAKPSSTNATDSGPEDNSTEPDTGASASSP